MPRTGILPALVVLALSMCLATSADARRRHHGDDNRGQARGDDRAPGRA